MNDLTSFKRWPLISDLSCMISQDRSRSRQPALGSPAWSLSGVGYKQRTKLPITLKGVCNGTPAGRAAVEHLKLFCLDIGPFVYGSLAW